jgi:hypothetical protein
MLAILRKSSFFFITHLCSYSAPALYMLLERKGGGFLSVMALWLPAWLSSSVLWSERQESYAFLRVLPVTDRQIVRTKFGLALGFAFLYWIILFLFNRLTWGSDPVHYYYAALANLCCAVSLVLVAGWYLFSWRFGPSALNVAVVVFTLVVIFGTFIVNIRRMVRTRGIGVLAPRWLAEGPWFYHILLLVATLAAYYGLMRLAVRVKEKSEVTT